MGGVSADGKTLWLSGRNDGVVYGFDTRSGRLIAKIPVGGSPHGHRGVATTRPLLARPHGEHAVSRRLLSVVLLATLLAGCGDHPPGAGPRPSDSVRTTPTPVYSVAARVQDRLRGRCELAPAVPGREGRGGPDTNGSVILAGGLLDGDRSTSRVLSIGLLSGRIEQIPPLAVPVHDTAGGRVVGAPTVVGGGNATEQSVVQSRVRGRWHPVGNLPTTRSDLAVAEWRGSAYVIGGYDGTSVPRTVLRLSRARLLAPSPHCSVVSGTPPRHGSTPTSTCSAERSPAGSSARCRRSTWLRVTRDRPGISRGRSVTRWRSPSVTGSW